MTGLFGKGLQRPAGGGPDTDDPPAAFSGLVEQGGGLGTDLTVFRVHLVVRDLLSLDGPEGAQTDVQGHVSQLYALGCDRLQQLRREVQAGGRRRG